MKWPDILRLSTILKGFGLDLKEGDLDGIPVKSALLKCANPYCKHPFTFEGLILYNPWTQKIYHQGQCEIYDSTYFLSSGKETDIGHINPYDKCPQHIMLPTNSLLDCYFTPSKYISFEKAQELFKKGKLKHKTLEDLFNS